MTETIKTVLLNYGVCDLVGGVLEYISPEKTKKALRVTVVTVMLFMVVLPVVNTEINLDNGLISEEEISQNTSLDALMHTANLLERKLREEMKEILINLEVNEYEIYISTTCDENENTVFLDEIKIDVGKDFKNKTEAIKKQVPEEYQKVLKVGVKNE